MKLLYAARTDVGMIRSGNEDNFTVDANPERGIFIVADGMGGHAAGEVASEMAVQIVVRELAPGMVARLWGYNGQSPGPTIEVVEGDFVRIFVTNKLPEHTSIH